jgi:hypothetical protein
LASQHAAKEAVLRKHFIWTKTYLGFEVFTMVTIKNAVFWDVMLCRSYANRRFWETCRLHLQGRNIRERGNYVSRWLAVYCLEWLRKRVK